MREVAAHGIDVFGPGGLYVDHGRLTPTVGDVLERGERDALRAAIILVHVREARVMAIGRRRSRR
jgi:hypothetical protein